MTISDGQTFDELHKAIGGERRTTQWTNRRLAIVQAAAEVFNEVGFARGTTKQIAERVGLGQSSVYHYVGNKTDLMVEIVRRVDEALSPIVDNQNVADTPPAEQLRTLVIRFTEEVLANQAIFAACWSELDAVPERELREFLAKRDQFSARIEAIVVLAQNAGVLPEGDPKVTAQAILGLVSSVHLWFDPNGPLSPTGVGEHFANLIGARPPA